MAVAFHAPRTLVASHPFVRARSGDPGRIAEGVGRDSLAHVNVRRLLPALVAAAVVAVAGCGGSGDEVVQVTQTVHTGAEESPKDVAAREYAAIADSDGAEMHRAWGDVQATCRSGLWKQCAVALREYARVTRTTADRVARVDMPADAASHRDAMVVSMSSAVDTARTLATNLSDGKPSPLDTTHMRTLSRANTRTAAHARLVRARLGLPAAP